MLQADAPDLRTPHRLLTDDDPAAFEVVNRNGAGPVVLVCEHAGRVVPKSLGDMGIPAAEFDRHIAYDIGAEQASRRISAILDAPLVLQPFSRLVIDCNRDFEAPDCFPAVSDSTVIPANVDLPAADRLARFEEIHAAYHAEVTRILDARSGPTTLVSIHSFTPKLVGASAERPWEIGLLFIRDDRLARRLMASMDALRPGVSAAYNEPYAGCDLTDYAIPVHGEQRGIEHVLIEIRNNLIDDESGQRQWSDFLAQAIGDAVPGYRG